MRKAFKLLFIITLLLAVVISTFYFWASSDFDGELPRVSIEEKDVAQIQMYKDSISIMTYNLGYLSGMTNNKAVDRSEDLFTDNFEAAKTLLEENMIDIASFQEIDFNSDRSYHHDQAGELAEALGYPFIAKAINWNKTYVPFPYWPPSNHFGSIVSGQAILSRFEIKEQSFIDLKKADYPFYYNAFYLDRMAQVAKISVYGKDLILINVHLEPWDADNRKEQVEQLLGLLESYSDLPVILLGDFNATLQGSEHSYEEEVSLRLLKEFGNFKNAIPDSSYFENEDEYLTFNSEEPSIRIDYIFYDASKLEMKHARVMKEAGEISDHLPVMAYFSFR